MKNETAVEWLQKEIIRKIVRSNDKDIIVILTKNKMLLELFNIAKAIEKEQIINAVDCYPLTDFNGEEYYNETYKKEK